MSQVLLHHVCQICHYETKEIMNVFNDEKGKRYSFKKEVQGKKPFYRIVGVGCIRCPCCGNVSTFEDAEIEEDYND